MAPQSNRSSFTGPVPAQPLTLPSDESAQDDRAADRVATEKAVACTIRGQSSTALMYDLSVDGCMIGDLSDALVVGQTITIEFVEDIASVAEVVWQRSGCAGIRFAERLHPVVVQFLGFKQPSYLFDQKPPCDGFGRLFPELPSEGVGALHRTSEHS